MENRPPSRGFGPDGATRASGSDDGTVRLWDTMPLKTRYQSRSEAEMPYERHEGEGRALAFSPDGKTLDSSSGDTTMRL
jgi:WD40 repeat protein